MSSTLRLFSLQSDASDLGLYLAQLGLGTRKESTEGGAVWARRSKATVPRDGLHRDEDKAMAQRKDGVT